MRGFFCALASVSLLALGQGCGSARGPKVAVSSPRIDGGASSTADGGAKPASDAAPGSAGGASLLPCVNSLDCVSSSDGRQVCDRVAALCVECVVDADCSSGYTCLADRCRPPCASDKDCTSRGELCDRMAGYCVDCIGAEDCGAGATCLGGVCAVIVGPRGGADAGPDASAAGDGGASAGDAGDAGGGQPGTGGPLPSTCPNGRLDGLETDLDCGGPGCPACAPGRKCSSPVDCTSGACTGSRCEPNDVGATCTAASDCLSGACNGSVCAQTGNCSNQAKDGSETDVDCGGKACTPCLSGTCITARDCYSRICANGTCQTASCSDGVFNGQESDVDCGGGTALGCGPCALGRRCRGGSDCESQTCVGGQCTTPSCSDGVRNGTETSTDCGGSCPPCRVGKACLKPADCGSKLCDTSSSSPGSCLASPDCANGVRDGFETGTDCGGTACPRCASGVGCAVGIDCTSNNCSASKCGDCQPASCPSPSVSCCRSNGTCGLNVPIVGCL